jgi:polysaccharide biosynthesis protein PelD
LLISIRYGFANGVICALLVIAGAASILKYSDSLDSFSFSIGVGMVLTAMIIGEFRDYWHEINQKHNLDHDYMRQKLDSFTQNYHLLKASHDQLEQRIAGQRISLRASINQLQEVVLENTERRFESLCQPYLELISEIGGLEIAGIYRVSQNKVEQDYSAILGDQHELHLDDPMLKDMIETNKLLTPAKLAENEVHKSRYQVCIPLVDTSGILQAILVAEKAKFFLLTPANIALMSLVSNYAADLLNEELQVPVLRPEQSSLFQMYIERASYNKIHYGADTCLVAFKGLPEEYQSALEEIINFRRGADVYWHCLTLDREKKQQPALAVLLPLTSVWGAQQYIKRINELLAKSMNSEKASTVAPDFDVIGPIIVGKDQAATKHIVNELGIND